MIEIQCDWFWVLLAIGIVIGCGIGCLIVGIRVGMRVMRAELASRREKNKLLGVAGDDQELFGESRPIVKRRYEERRTPRRMSVAEREALSLMLSEGRLDPAIRKLVEEELRK
jgi:hypothetical protein